MSEVFVLKRTTTYRNSLLTHEQPDGNPGNIGAPLLSDLTLCKRGDLMAVGDLDGDGDPEVTVVARNRNYLEKFQLWCHELPDGMKGETGPMYASDPTVGEDIRGLAAGDWDDDGTDELIFLRGGRLQIYATPQTLRENIGLPLASDNNAGTNVIDRGLAAGNFDNDPGLEKTSNPMGAKFLGGVNDEYFNPLSSQYRKNTHNFKNLPLSCCKEPLLHLGLGYNNGIDEFF